MALEENEHDRLRPLITDSAFAQGILAELDGPGFAVLPGVFSRQEAEQEYERMWRWVEATSKGVRRSRPETWQKRGGGKDPWPCSQRDMMQGYQAGWLFSEAREKMAERVFEKLYGTRELHSSKDGFTLQRPTSAPLTMAPNDHFDQRGTLTGLQCVQGSLALTDQETEDGCFLCWPGSQRHHAELARKEGRARQDWVRLDARDFELLEERGVRTLRVPVKKGDVVLWRSDLAHKGAPPVGCRESFRAVVYICMLPALLTPREMYPWKRKAYEQLETGSHLPFREEWFKPRSEPSFELRPYFTAPPELTPRQRLLYGLEMYGKEAPQGPLKEARIVRLARRGKEEDRVSPYKGAVESVEVAEKGVIGDYNHYRTTRKGGTLARAVSLATLEVFGRLREKGYDVGPGDLGENVTLEVPEEAMEIGARLRMKELELEVTEAIVPCAKLEQLPSVRALPEGRRKAFPAACKGLRGWYAKVLSGGELMTGESLAIAAPAREEPAMEAAPNAGEAAPEAPRRKRWQKVEK